MWTPNKKVNRVLAVDWERQYHTEAKDSSATRKIEVEEEAK